MWARVPAADGAVTSASVAEPSTLTTRPSRCAKTVLYEEARSGRRAIATASSSVRAVSCSRTMSSRGTPTRSSLGASSLPVSESPAEFQPTLIHGPMPSEKTTGSPGTRHSIAMTEASETGERSLVWATHTWPSGVAGGAATMSLQRPSTVAPPVACDGRTVQISSIEAANSASGSTPAPSAAPSISSTSQGVAASVASR